MKKIIFIYLILANISFVFAQTEEENAGNGEVKVEVLDPKSVPKDLRPEKANPKYFEDIVPGFKKNSIYFNPGPFVFGEIKPIFGYQRLVLPKMALGVQAGKGFGTTNFSLYSVPGEILRSTARGSNGNTYQPSDISRKLKPNYHLGLNIFWVRDGVPLNYCSGWLFSYELYTYNLEEMGELGVKSTAKITTHSYSICYSTQKIMFRNFGLAYDFGYFLAFGNIQNRQLEDPFGTPEVINLKKEKFVLFPEFQIGLIRAKVFAVF